MKFLFHAAATIGATTLLSGSALAQQFTVINLVTDDQSVNPAPITDTNLKNAWGVSFSPTSPFWVSDNGAGVSTLYSVNPSTDLPSKLGLTVSFQGDGSVTGQTFNSLGSRAFNGDPFLFVSEDGTISGWRNTLGTTAERFQVGDQANVYKGAAFAQVGDHGYLLSANFKSGAIDVLKGDVGAPNLAGNFTDPNLPANYAPFNIRNLGGKLYVTYALQDGKDDLPGAGHGFVNEFDLQGNLLRRIGTAGDLNSPWGLEIAPASFGPLAGDLLVGNFGDGRINAFDLGVTPTFEGQLLGADAKPLSIDGLWAITVGNNGSGGSSDKLYFTAGPDDETHGLFGLLQSASANGTVPEGGATLNILAGALGILALGQTLKKT